MKEILSMITGTFLILGLGLILTAKMIAPKKARAEVLQFDQVQKQMKHMLARTNDLSKYEMKKETFR